MVANTGVVCRREANESSRAGTTQLSLTSECSARNFHARVSRYFFHGSLIPAKDKDNRLTFNVLSVPYFRDSFTSWRAAESGSSLRFRSEPDEVDSEIGALERSDNSRQVSDIFDRFA